MTETYRKIFDRCQEIVGEFDLPTIDTVLNDYEPLLNDDKAVFTFVDLSGLPDGLAAVANHICGENILKDYVNPIRHWNDWCIQLEYGEEKAVYSNAILPECKISAESLNEQKPGILIITAPVAVLSGKTIVLLSAGTNQNACTRDMSASERLFLLTNATMAMTQTQKEWISGFVKDNYDFERFSICINGMDKLIDESQETQVLDYVQNYLDRFGSSVSVLTEDKIQKEIAEDDINILIDKSKKQIIKNLIHDIECILNYELDGCNIKKEDYIRTASEVEQYSVRLLKTGEISAKNVLGNEIKAIIDAVSNSAEEYSDAMFESIRQTILSAKDIEEVESRISPYMEKSWDYFAKQTSVQISKDFDIISSKLTQRMEEDVEDMMKQLDLQAQAMLERFVNNSDSVYLPYVEYDPASDEALKTVSRNARNMMILSIPLLFVSPTLSVVALLGGGIYSNLGKKQEGLKYREELVDHVDKACTKAKKTAIQSFTDTLNDEYDRMSQLVVQGYQNLIKMIQEELEKRKMAADVSSERAVRIQSGKEELLKITQEL